MERLRRATGKVLSGLSWVLVPAGVVLVFMVVHLAFRHPYPSGDSGNVSRAAAPILSCLRAGRLIGCPGVTHFPPAQLLISTVAVWAGFTDVQAYDLLTELNLAAFAWVLVATWRFFRERGSSRGALAAAVMVSSAAINYAVTPFGEMLGVALGVGLVLSAQRGRAGQAALFALALGLTKEVAAPLSLALGVAALPVAAADTWRGWVAQRWRQVAVLVAGSFFGWVAAAAFNVFRYGSVVNTHLLTPSFRVDSVGQQLLHLAGLFISPSAGMVVLAPLAMLLLVVAALQGGLRWRSPAAAQRWWPLVFTVLASVGLAAWFTPFGWWAWGPRLSLPWLVPAVVFALAVTPPGALEGRWRFVVWAVTPLALLNAAHLASPEAMFRYFQGIVCPFPIGSAPYFECANRNIFALDGLTAFVAREALVQPLVQAVAAVHLLVVLALLARWLRPADAGPR